MSTQSDSVRAAVLDAPNADPRIVEALPTLRILAAPFLEHPKSAPILHVSVTLTGLDIDVTGVERKGGGLSAGARVRAAQACEGTDIARVTLAGETVYQVRAPMVRFSDAVVAVPPGAFLQAVPAAEEEEEPGIPHGFSSATAAAASPENAEALVHSDGLASENRYPSSCRC